MRCESECRTGPMMSGSGFRHAISGYPRDRSADDFVDSVCVPQGLPAASLTTFPFHRMRRLFTKFVFAPVSVTTASFLYFVRYPRPPSHGPIDSDDEMFLQSREDHLAQLPTKTLLRGLFVHSFCTHPRLVDLGIHLMKAQNRPNPVFDSLIRHTFLAQFCGFSPLRLLC